MIYVSMCGGGGSASALQEMTSVARNNRVFVHLFGVSVNAPAAGSGGG